MSQTLPAGVHSGRPQTLRPVSLFKRAVVGLLILVFGVIAAAWLMHASIATSDAGDAASSAGTVQASAATPGNSKR